MSQKIRKRPLEKMIIATSFPAGAVMEFLALCAGGRMISEDAFAVHDTHYRRAPEPEKTIEIYPCGDSQPASDRDLVACAGIYLGAKLLQAPVDVEGTWKVLLPSDQYLKSDFSPLPVIKDPTDRLCGDSSLRLGDLEEIHEILAGSPELAPALEADESFRAVFPGMESRWGKYGFLRHRSGTEIKTRWDGERLLSHAIETPNPAEPHLIQWMRINGLKSGSDFRRSYREKKWNLARLLHRVPTEHKQRVYQWVTSTIYEIERADESHCSLGLPESFECEFENSILIADRNLDFELIEC